MAEERQHAIIRTVLWIAGFIYGAVGVMIARGLGRWWIILIWFAVMLIVQRPWHHEYAHDL